MGVELLIEALDYMSATEIRHYTGLSHDTIRLVSTGQRKASPTVLKKLKGLEDLDFEIFSDVRRASDHMVEWHQLLKALDDNDEPTVERLSAFFRGDDKRQQLPKSHAVFDRRGPRIRINSKRIRFEREWRTKLTHLELAEIVNIPPRTMYNIERGRQKSLSVSQYERLREFLGIEDDRLESK